MMPVAFGPLCLTHDAFFDLTPFQFLQLHNGWVERERNNVIKHTQILLLIRNVNRGENDKELKLGDILPWYDDYVGEDNKEPVAKERFVDTRIPQADRIRARILESKHFDAETIDHSHPEWIEANRVANLICNAQKNALKDVIQVDGVMIRKADPREWGEKFPDW